MGPLFQLFRSICQGCPLSPFLFLIYSEVMSLFMRHDRVVASQLLFPRTVELDDEPTIYTKGTNENLHTIHCMQDDFC